jgi:Pentapeptide repeats (8 copies)
MRGADAGYMGSLSSLIVGMSTVAIAIATTELTSQVDIWSNPLIWTGIALIVFAPLPLIFARLSRSPGLSYITYAGQLENSSRILDSDTSSMTMRKLAVGALWGILNVSAELHNDVVAILADFVRGNAIKTIQKERPDSDVQAALTALARRPVRSEDAPLDLSATNLSGAVLCGANLRSAALRDSNLSGALLYGADLSNANLQSADLSRAWLNKLDENSPPDVDFSVPREARRASGFRSARRARAKNLECTIPRKSPGADLSGANINSVKLADANLRGARVDVDQSLPPEWRRDPRTGLAVENL